MIDCGLYNMDCFNGFPLIDDKSINMILCDMPYGTTQNRWDSVLPLDKLWGQYERIIKDDGAIVLFSQQPFTSVLACSNLKLFKYEWIWEKTMATGFLNCNHAPLKSHENILVFGKASTSPSKSLHMIYNPQMGTGKPISATRSGRGSENYGKQKPTYYSSDGTRYPRDVVIFRYDKEKLHPTQKPVALCEYLIRTYTNEGDLVLDNCAGSGSTLISAYNTKRRFIGFEKDEEIYKMAQDRLEKHGVISGEVMNSIGML